MVMEIVSEHEQATEVRASRDGCGAFFFPDGQ